MTDGCSAWLMDDFFRRIPKELDDAAFVDGASHWQTFWKIDLPLALPGLGAAAVFAFTHQLTVDWRGMAAMSVLMMIPAVLFVLLMSRSLTKGLTFGAVKG